MNFGFSEEQEELRRYAREWLEGQDLRTALAREHAFDVEAWSAMAEMGWLAMAIPEEYGGAGFGFLEQAVILEELGRTLHPSPYFASCVLAANVLLIGGSDEQKRRLLPGIADGTTIATVAQVESSGDWSESGVAVAADPVGDGTWRLSGSKDMVLAAQLVDLMIVAARTPAGISLFAVPAGGLEVEPLESMDPTQPMGRVALDGVHVSTDDLIGAEGGGWDVLQAVNQVANVAQAVSQLGGAAQCLDMAVAYAKDRQQFKRPIGSFQAIKHRCADMLIQVESARAAAYYAAWAVSENNPEADLVAPLAAAYCSEAFFACASENIQVHGGIGFTWEHDAHFYFKRAKSTELYLGSPTEQRRVLADRIGL